MNFLTGPAYHRYSSASSLPPSSLSPAPSQQPTVPAHPTSMSDSQTTSSSVVASQKSVPQHAGTDIERSGTSHSPLSPVFLSGIRWFDGLLVFDRRVGGKSDLKRLLWLLYNL
jgi:hypothetical protein